MSNFIDKWKVEVTLGTAIVVLIYTVTVSMNISNAYNDLQNTDVSITREMNICKDEYINLQETQEVLKSNQIEVNTKLDYITKTIDEIRTDLKQHLTSLR